MPLPPDNAEKRIGLLAGWGRYPIVVAETLRRQGYEVYCLGVKDHADPALDKICHHSMPIGVGRLGQAVRYFKRHGVKRATMAGKFFKVRLLGRFSWVKHFPDLKTVRTYGGHFLNRGGKDRKDDSLLLALVHAFEVDGITFAPATDFAPELLVKNGLLSGRLSRGQWKDVAFAWNIAREMGSLDIGQSVCVIRRAVLAVEAVEGTDACIRRAGDLCRTGGFSVIKVAKPRQDMRFDVPTIGLGTLQTMHEVGANLLAVEADKTILIDEKEVVSFAQRHGITLAVLSEADLLARQEAA